MSLPHTTRPDGEAHGQSGSEGEPAGEFAAGSRGEADSEPASQPGPTGKLSNSQLAHRGKPTSGLTDSDPASQESAGQRRQPGELTSQACQCSLQCGSPVCERAKKRNLRQSLKQGDTGVWRCPDPPLPGSSFCWQCCCLREGRQSCRAPRSRFCRLHAREEAQLKRGQHMGTAGVFRVDKSWPWPLQMCAVHGWMLERMAPCDLDAFYAAASEIVTQPAGLDGQVALTGLTFFFCMCGELPSSSGRWQCVPGPALS